MTIIMIDRNSLFYHINVNSFLVYFILIHVCMAKEPSRGSYAIKYVCMYQCDLFCNNYN